ncbi:polysaccharide deacetylase family protein [Gorillibacterium sp. sgz5001074]|uniref:polysaccharide deacetylase family protein n=1 Tax=Gorillibacterium sp. sgz5001074 TaxID=3446695 RepID=UPI003F66A23F
MIGIRTLMNRYVPGRAQLFAVLLLLLLTAVGLAACSEPALAPVAAPARIPILLYHEINPDPLTWDYGTVGPDKLRSDLVALREHGYTPILFKDIDEARKGKAPLPAKPVLVTFDDGYYNNYEFAYPLLKELNMKATISIIGWSVGRKTHMDGITPIRRHFTWDEAKEMVKSGLVEIEHHSYDLHNQTDTEQGVKPHAGESREAYRERFKKDTLKLKNEIEKKLGTKVSVYTYPYGYYNEDAEEIIKELGFEYSLTVEDGVSDLSKSTHLLKRINVPFNMSSEQLIQSMERQ